MTKADEANRMTTARAKISFCIGSTLKAARIGKRSFPATYLTLDLQRLTQTPLQRAFACLCVFSFSPARVFRLKAEYQLFAERMVTGEILIRQSWPPLKRSRATRN